ncbi:MAG: 50S ribosomal protein L16 [Bacteroidia bacterium]|nr:50S ribosomal protein L16 [Bacteroidia bacterium]MCX7764863.1 50S ribosomal protein L16 [Bacteroidia bacterium]MDW8057180.1 50S ribosomal protein L16 [Bacteroidia bacterium]
MLQPKRTKFRKEQKGKLLHQGTVRGIALRGNQLAFGSFGLKAIDGGVLSSRQIEAARVALTRYLRREGKIWIRIFPHKPITRKPLEVRMGKGKGNVEFYAAVVKPGTVLFECEGVSEEAAREAFRLAAFKLPVKTKFIRRVDYEG